MQFSFFVVVLVRLFGSTDSSHFRGGSITWKPVNVNAVTNSTVDIIVEQSYSWKRSTYGCNDTTILTQGTIGDFSYLRCSTYSCSGYTNNLSTVVPCTDYSVSADVSSGKKSSVLTLNSNSQLTLTFTGGAWLPLLTFASTWSITTMINLQARIDNGRLNTPPVSNVLPVIRVPINIQSTIMIPVADDDNDYVRCRWAQKNHTINFSQNNVTVDECADVCNAVPNAILYGDNNGTSCKLVFTGGTAGFYAVALQIEDFYIDENITAPLSSVPVQFLISVYSGSCQPSIIGAQPNGAVINVARNTSMSSVTIIAEIGCINTSVVDFLKISPTGMTTSAIVQNPTNSSLYSIQLNWIPAALGSQVFCCAAIDNTLGQSDMYCVTFVVIDSLNTTMIASNATAITTAQSKELNIGLIVGMAILGLLVCCTICSCCLYCCWPCLEWLCSTFRCTCFRSICQKRYKSSSEIPVSRDPYKHNGDISVSKAARLSNELVELGLRYADESLTNLKQSFANIRNSVELIKNTRQMIQQSVKKTTSKQDVPSNSSNNVVIVHRLKSTKNNTQQIDSNHKEKASLTHDCNANSTDSPTESEENDDNDNINVFPYQQQNDRSKPFIKQQMNSITVTKISRVKNSAVPSVSC
ncbi:unnamed protein product [Adineta steineri]|uniref:Uncharacterized protein n=3 Tax=Adineta steineri TaxID=433720 RepID=A0A813XUH9_9BILA|nr:unnamed protein product [Adineta steineri]CAF0877643.1 unnamed protein product [Adineta steineri]CAF3844689.1 unnamed protein product [Adineta steineri]CAF4053602.1 unnamed protein product [Adineta steineri]